MGGARGGNTGEGRTDAGPKRTTAYKKGVGNIDEKGKKTPSYRSDNPDAFRNRGATKIKKGIKTPSVVLNLGSKILSKPLQAGSRVTRDFFTDKVLDSKAYKGTSKTEFLSMSAEKQEEIFGNYMDNRMSGATDAYGNVNTNRDTQGGGTYKDPSKILNQPKVDSQMNNSDVKSKMIVADKMSPTSVEMSEDDTKLAVNRRGRKVTALTDIASNQKATLSKKVLLG